ncbi:MAG TPA: tetratricopeptide repeat protein [Pyrinomonadaceae bacterium]|jgi:tetratricopeptide (TPR) repeat protein
MRTTFIGAACCLLPLALGACGGTTSAPVATNQQGAATANRAATSANTQSAPPAAASPRAATTASGGEPVDTSKYDAEIKRLEEKARKSSADQATRLALAKAYTDRGDALTGVRQYRAALGDYRRALRNDPNNEQAKQMSGTIVSILQSMGRDVPPEGQEPAPLPLKQ